MQQLEKPGFLCQCRLVPESNEGLLEKVTTINGLSAEGTERDSESIKSSKKYAALCIQKNCPSLPFF